MPPQTAVKVVEVPPGPPVLSTLVAEAIALLTEWKQFAELDYQKLYVSMTKPAFVFDGRNILDHTHLFEVGFNVLFSSSVLTGQTAGGQPPAAQRRQQHDPAEHPELLLLQNAQKYLDLVPSNSYNPIRID